MFSQVMQIQQVQEYEGKSDFQNCSVCICSCSRNCKFCPQISVHWTESPVSSTYNLLTWAKQSLMSVNTWICTMSRRGIFHTYKLLEQKCSSQWSAVIKLSRQFTVAMLFSLIYTQLNHVFFYEFLQRKVKWKSIFKVKTACINSRTNAPCHDFMNCKNNKLHHFCDFSCILHKFIRKLSDVCLQLPPQWLSGYDCFFWLSNKTIAYNWDQQNVLILWSLGSLMVVMATNVNELKPPARLRAQSLALSMQQVSIVFPRQWPNSNFKIFR